MSRVLKSKLRKKKQKNRFAGILLLITGLLVSGYPMLLWAEGKIEQIQLERDFRLGSIQPYISFPHDWQSEEGPDGAEYVAPVEVELPVFVDFPSTKLGIPLLSVEAMVVKVPDLSVFARRLKHPPGYYPGSAFPGQIGNVSIAGHRNGPAGFFKDLHKLKAGDMIVLQVMNYYYHYEVERVFVTDKYDWSVVDATDYAALTLTTCQRVGTDSSAKRLIVRARFKAVSLD